MSDVQPVLYVDDVREAVSWYTTQLGFETQFVGTDDGTSDGVATIAAVALEGATILLSQLGMFATDEGERRGAGVTLWFHLERNVDAFHADLQERGVVAITQEPTTFWWGDRTFNVLDPWRYRLTFCNSGQPSTEPAEATEPASVGG